MGHKAPRGKIWVCVSCGRLSHDKEGRYPHSIGYGGSDCECPKYAELIAFDALQIISGRVVRTKRPEERDLLPAEHTKEGWLI